MKTVKDIEHLKGVKALVRVDFNVPVENGKIVDDFRIRAALPTIDLLTKGGAKVIMIGHMEASDGSNPSLQIVADHMGVLGKPVVFIKNIRQARELIDENLRDGGCALLENLRVFEAEKANDDKFSRELASLADIFVNEAFSVCHRRHASIVGVPKFLPSYAGLQLESEVSNLSKAFNPSHPFLFVIGGAKFETKLPLLNKFIDIADSIFIGGALAHDIFKARGYEVGQSKVSVDNTDLSKYLNSGKIIVPVDVITEDGKTKQADSLDREDKIVDAGAKTIEQLKEKVSSAGFILWNGPLGIYEQGFKKSTLELAQTIASTAGRAGKDVQNYATPGGVTSIVGGGDTVAAIEELDIQDKFSFVSTGGGAMLEFLADATLPGIEAIGESNDS